MRVDKTGPVDNMVSNYPRRIKILTVQEVAAILRVHPSTVSRYAISGELRSYVIGSRRLFREDDIWAFFDNQADRRHAVRKEI